MRRVVVGKHTVAESLADTDVQVIAPPVRFACDVANALEKGDAEPFTRALDHKSFDKMLVSIDTAPLERKAEALQESVRKLLKQEASETKAAGNSSMYL